MPHWVHATPAGSLWESSVAISPTAGHDSSKRSRLACWILLLLVTLCAVITGSVVQCGRHALLDRAPFYTKLATHSDYHIPQESWHEDTHKTGRRTSCHKQHAVLSQKPKALLSLKARYVFTLETLSNCLTPRETMRSPIIGPH